MLPQLRSFLAVIEEGSIHRAAARLHLSQSALSRQMQALENEVGGRLLERTSTGVRPTSGGHALAERTASLITAYDTTMASVRQHVRGEGSQLRIGYLASAASEHLSPGLRILGQSFPETKIRLLDLSPGEQITALRQGEIDVAILDHGGDLLSRDFHIRKFASTASVVALSASHPLSSRSQIHIRDLRDETFICGPESEVPGYARRLTQLCRKSGKFKPRLISSAGTLADGLASVMNDEYIALLPAYARSQVTPCVSMVPIADPEATWDIFVVWQRGQTSKALRSFVSSLNGKQS